MRGLKEETKECAKTRTSGVKERSKTRYRVIETADTVSVIPSDRCRHRSALHRKWKADGIVTHWIAVTQ